MLWDCTHCVAHMSLHRVARTQIGGRAKHRSSGPQSQLFSHSFDRRVEVPPPDAAARAAFFAATVQRPEIASHLRWAAVPCLPLFFEPLCVDMLLG